MSTVTRSIAMPAAHAPDSPNAPEAVARRMQAGRISRTAPWLVLGLRTALFALAQAGVAAGFALSGVANAWEAAVPWWPVYLIGPNLVTLGVLVWLLGREGLSYRDVWRNAGSGFGSRRREILTWTGLLALGLPFSAAGFMGAGMLLYGGQMPEYVTALPMWAALLALVIMPASIAIVELPLYYGYALPRLEALTGRRWLPLLLAAFWLALQHSALPLMFDARFILFRFLQMILLALYLGFIYQRTRRLAPLMVLHYAADLSLGMTVFMMSV